jgi:hypothetical protein
MYFGKALHYQILCSLLGNSGVFVTYRQTVKHRDKHEEASFNAFCSNAPKASSKIFTTRKCLKASHFVLLAVKLRLLLAVHTSCCFHCYWIMLKLAISHWSCRQFAFWLPFKRNFSRRYNYMRNSTFHKRHSLCRIFHLFLYIPPISGGLILKYCDFST